MKTTIENITKTVSFVDAEHNRKNVVIEITYRNGYKELTICDDNGQGSFIPANDPQKELLKIWNNYHLKDVGLVADIDSVIDNIIEGIEHAEDERKGEPLTNLSDADLIVLIAEQTNFVDDRDIELCAAFVRMFDLSENDLSDVEIDGTRCVVQGIDYIAGNDDDISEAMKEYVRDSLWAFNASFLASETEMPIEVFEALSEKCEGGNEAILRIVEKTCGLESLIESAECADGRGHFLNRYNGEELEQSINGEMYFAYRQ